LKAHAKSIGLTCFLAGEQLMDASADKNYKMAFEPGAKKPKRKKPPADDDCSELFERWRI